MVYKSACIHLLAAIIRSVQANSRLKTWTDYVNGSPTPLLWPSIKQKQGIFGQTLDSVCTEINFGMPQQAFRPPIGC